MMQKIGFLGCGKIGSALVAEAEALENVQVVFVQDLVWENAQADYKIIREPDEALYADCDLVIESATAAVLNENIEMILKHCDLMMFSVTAFSDPAFQKKTEELCRTYGRKIYIPHGAILGLDGIFDGKRLWDKVCIETVKSPKSLGREEAEKTVLYEGSTREACVLFPRNVNVHAAVALAGIGFDKTVSRITADPAVTTNSHIIRLEGEGVNMEIHVSSFTTGGVTGKYTPYSACGSLRRVLEQRSGLKFV